jgi:pyrroline-5-carboxylate reductase
MRISFIGGGNMATALIGGMLDAGFQPADIDVLEPEAAKGTELAHRFGCSSHEQPGEWLAAADVIVLAVKPQQIQEAARSIKAFLARPLVVSIAAGVRAGSIARWLGTEHVVRAMPNTPALIRAGISGLIAMPAVTEEQRAAATRILEAVGDIVWLDDEALLDPVTAISGSGPAYVFYFIEALQKAGRDLGLADAQARALSIQTFVGAARLAAQADEPIAALRERVTSKGGTTAAALASLENDHVQEAIAKAAKAASLRARALGDEFDR